MRLLKDLVPHPEARGRQLPVWVGKQACKDWSWRGRESQGRHPQLPAQPRPQPASPRARQLLSQGHTWG